LRPVKQQDYGQRNRWTEGLFKTGYGMRERALAYYIDFYVYPPVLAAFPAYAALTARGTAATWLAMAAIGLALWTLVEYFIHRILFHNVPFFRDLHDAHHKNPKALIDSPIWSSLTIVFVVVLAPSAWLFGTHLGTAFTFGMALGYFMYSIVHHAMHFWAFPHDSYFYRAKHRHALHHYSEIDGNFGVTTPFWDYVFGTALPEPQLAKQAQGRRG
jgi:sterol desaturase/sphingolipid hydroxylase (fatty acid hydroxylase superfamily)